MKNCNTDFASLDCENLIDFHRTLYPIDTHLDSVSLSLFAGYDFWEGDWKATRNRALLWIIRSLFPKGIHKPLYGHVSGRDFLQGGYGGACFSAHGLLENLVPAFLLNPWNKWNDHIGYVEEIVASSCGILEIARSSKQVEQLQENGIRSAILSVEGAHILGPPGARSQKLRLNRLKVLADAGVAYLTLNHYCNTDISEAGYRPLNP